MSKFNLFNGSDISIIDDRHRYHVILQRHEFANDPAFVKTVNKRWLFGSNDLRCEFNEPLDSINLGWPLSESYSFICDIVVKIEMIPNRVWTNCSMTVWQIKTVADSEATSGNFLVYDRVVNEHRPLRSWERYQHETGAVIPVEDRLEEMRYRYPDLSHADIESIVRDHP